MKPELQAKQRARKPPAILSAALENKLAAYGVAAVAAGVGFLALIPPAEAKIIYTPTHVKILDSSTYLILNHAGVPNFVVSNGYASTGGQNFGAGLEANAVGTKTFVETSGSSSGFAAAAALHPGSRIPPGKMSHGFKKDGLLLGFYDNGIGGYRWGGKWRNASDLYLGLKFQISGKTHFGWARMTLTDGAHCEGILTGYAYETIPNKPIIAGKTKGGDVITVQPTTLGHLARGASAIPRWRNKAESTPNSGANQ